MSVDHSDYTYNNPILKGFQGSGEKTMESQQTAKGWELSQIASGNQQTQLPQQVTESYIDFLIRIN